ncbi:flagellar hook capping FlgD N-terminal domain-containing protein, partial [Paraconexibacter sp.]|uniref:flagellar hook capping FlgD N-terminal domain-containing protein n=1 Tax=Paraconexibacter sp. TaxID=2949640 RepID=UPI0035659288
MPVNAVTTSTPVTATNQSNAASSLQLGKDAFMKMMIESLRQQDPSNAADSKEFVQQLSQMTSL